MAQIATATGVAAQTRVRPFRPTDHRDCRDLWAELTEEHRRRYEERDTGADPGAGFEHYVARLELSGMWVADHAEAGVIGFAGLLLHGRRGEVEPVVVARPYRHAGVGRALLDRVAAEARRRRLRELSIAPDTRNEEAIRSFHRAGYQMLDHLTITLDLTDRQEPGRQGQQTSGADRPGQQAPGVDRPEGGDQRSRWQDGIEVHGMRFRY